MLKKIIDIDENFATRADLFYNKVYNDILANNINSDSKPFIEHLDAIAQKYNGTTLKEMKVDKEKLGIDVIIKLIKQLMNEVSFSRKVVTDIFDLFLYQEPLPRYQKTPLDITQTLINFEIFKTIVPEPEEMMDAILNENNLLSTFWLDRSFACEILAIINITHKFNTPVLPPLMSEEKSQNIFNSIMKSINSGR